MKSAGNDMGLSAIIARHGIKPEENFHTNTKQNQILPY